MAIFKKLVVVLGMLAFLLGATGFVLYAGNKAPKVPAISAAELANPTKPFVVKLHAQWCSVCLMTKGVWTQVQETYAGKVNLVVFDFTNKETTEASRTEAKRLGLEEFFNEYSGAAGLIAVLDPTSKTPKSEIGGEREFAIYSAAIDDALKKPTK